ncbi:MAG: glycerol acyltransferase [Bacteroides sp.]|nr:glycerol acyltransferase [Barnesiella sp.]MBD5369246.1 glycerol acyltransferase [Bacteroides sp.]
MRIDVDAVLRSRVPSLYRFIPGAVVRWLERTICQDRLNELLTGNAHADGVDFATGVLSDMGISYDVKGSLPASSRVIIASNHPLGGLDGLVLADFVGRAYGRKDIGFVVNDLLAAVAPLRSIFLAVNKHGKQSRQAVERLDRAMESDMPIVMFPAGLVSRRNSRGEIRDLQWQKMVVNKAIETGRDIVPLHFSGENSAFFYNFARWRAKLGLKFNIEMIYLPQELVKSEGKHFTITVGEPVSHTSLRGGKESAVTASQICRRVYGLVNQEWNL